MGFFAEKGGIPFVRKRVKQGQTTGVFSVQKAFEQFQKSNVIKNLSPATIDFYARKMQPFFDFIGDTNQPLESLTEMTVDNYILHLKSRNINDTTTNIHLRAVRAFLYWCMERGYLESFPIRMIRADIPVKEPYSPAELNLLLKKPDMTRCSFSEYRNWVMVNFLLGTGCRVSTLVNLHTKDIDLAAGTAKFRHMKARNAQIVPLSCNLVKVLEEYLSYRNSDSEGFLFVSSYGDGMSVSTVENAIRNYNHRRGVDKTSIHLFRHTYAKLYIQAGGDPFRLQRLLGHSDLTMTRRYVALYADDLKANYDALNPLEQMRNPTRREKPESQRTKIKMRK